MISYQAPKSRRGVSTKRPKAGLLAFGSTEKGVAAGTEKGTAIYHVVGGDLGGHPYDSADGRDAMAYLFSWLVICTVVWFPF